MKIFISWSGERSRTVAVALRDLIQMVFQRATVYTTADDIEKGARWAAGIADELEKATFGILCITPESVYSPWLSFEAGALSKTLSAERVTPLLIGLSIVDVQGPLAPFQACSADKDGIRRLLRELNSQSEVPLGRDMFSRLFDLTWPGFERCLEEIEALQILEYDGSSAMRSDRELLEEVVEELRSLRKRIGKIEGVRKKPGSHNHE